jgi:hypothetical protein
MWSEAAVPSKPLFFFVLSLYQCLAVTFGRSFMTLDQGIALFSATVSFFGLVFVGLQLRDGTRQQRSQSLVEIYGMNRELIALGFSHPQLFDVLAGNKADPVLQRRYLQLWFTHFSLVNAYVNQSVLKGDLKESLMRDLTDLLTLKSALHHWDIYGRFYPESFQKLVGDILKKNEPPVKAAQVKAHRHHDAKT